MPHDWQDLATHYGVHSFVLLPLRQANVVYGSVLLCIQHCDKPSEVGPTSRAGLGAEQVAELARYLSLGLLSSPTDQAVLRKVAEAAVGIAGALTLQDVVLALVEAVQTCLRLTTRLELECIPAVAFRGGQIAVFLRSQQLPYLPALTDCESSLSQPSPHQPRASHDQPVPPHQQPHNSHSHHRQQQPQQQQQQQQQLQSTLDMTVGVRSGARALAAKRLGDEEQASAGSASGSTLASAATALDPRQPEPHGGQQQQQQQQRWSHHQPNSSLSILASRSRGSVGQRECSELLQPALLSAGARIRATTLPLHQTLLGHHLEAAAAAAAAAAASGAASGAARGVPPAATAVLVYNSNSLGSSRGGSMGRSGTGSTSGVRALRQHDGGGGGAAAADGQSTAGRSSFSGAAVVPNCATFLMLDERLPYKDVLHVQRLLPLARAHSLVMVLSGPLAAADRRHEHEQGAVGRDARDTGPLTASPDQHQHRQRQVQPQRPGESCPAGAGGGAGVQHCLSSNGFLLLGGENEYGHGPNSVPIITAGGAAGGGRAPGSLPASITAGSMAAAAAAGRAQGPRALLEVVSLQNSAQQAAPVGSLALYVVASESVPRAILEQVAEETRQLTQMLHHTLTTALSSLALSAEWSRFTSLVLAKSSNVAVAAAAAAAVAAAASGPVSGAGSVSGNIAPSLSPLCSGVQLQASSNLAAAAQPYACLGSAVAPGDVSVPHAHSSSLRTYTHTPTQLSADIDELTGGGVSVALDTSTPHNTGTLSLMISSMRDALSTMQLERCPDYRSNAAEDIYAVRLLKLIGRGGQGMVFQGMLHNTAVAVKVIPCAEDPKAAAAAAAVAGSEPAAVSGSAKHAGPAAAGSAAAAADEAERRAAEAAAKLQQRHKRWLVRDALEVAVTSSISHPHIVQVLNFFTDTLVVEYPDEGGRYRLLPRQDNPTAKGNINTVIVMEYCDAGTLRHAVEAGCFKLRPAAAAPATATAGGHDTAAATAGGAATAASGSSSSSNLDMVSLLTTLLEVASGLRHLHEHRLAHCDVKPSNVLLRSCASDARGWTCKLSDFGCVRLMTDTDPATGRPVFHALSPVGSMSYMAPETMLRDAILDASIDVYSFGILMWECASSASTPYPGVPSQQLPGLVRRGLRPSFHPRVPAEYRQVASLCWAHDPRRRPTAAALVQTLQRLLTHALDGSLGDAGASMPLQLQLRAALQQQQPAHPGLPQAQLAQLSAQHRKRGEPQPAHPHQQPQPQAHHLSHARPFGELTRAKPKMSPGRAQSQGPLAYRPAPDPHAASVPLHAVMAPASPSAPHGAAARPPQLSLSRLGATGPSGSARVEAHAAAGLGGAAEGGGAAAAAAGGGLRRATGGGMWEHPGARSALLAEAPPGLRPRLLSSGNVVLRVEGEPGAGSPAGDQSAGAPAVPPAGLPAAADTGGEVTSQPAAARSAGRAEPAAAQAQVPAPAVHPGGIRLSSSDKWRGTREPEGEMQLADAEQRSVSLTARCSVSPRARHAMGNADKNINGHDGGV